MLGLLKKFFGVIIFIGLQLIHNIVLVSSVQQSESAMHIHISQMATHSSILAWRIPGTEELSGLLSMGSHRLSRYGKREVFTESMSRLAPE